jgi:hypothetical protein
LADGRRRRGAAPAAASRDRRSRDDPGGEGAAGSGFLRLGAVNHHRPAPSTALILSWGYKPERRADHNKTPVCSARVVARLTYETTKAAGKFVRQSCAHIGPICALAGAAPFARPASAEYLA